MNKTKQKILETSKKIFNRLGFGQVTIRMIAQDLGMSSGNLNYHFKKREDILEALYFEMVAVFDARIAALDHHDFSFESIEYDIRVSMERMVDYRFFWTDLHHLLLSNEKINAHFKSVFSARKAGTLLLLNALMDKGFLRKPIFEEEYELLADRMVQYGNTWLYASNLYQSDQSIDESIQYHTNALLMLFYPYLTAVGQRAFSTSFNQFNWIEKD